MRLSRTNAEKIVKELNTVIDQSVNMMNEEGIIIASTDQERVGQIHEGARKIIEQNLQRFRFLYNLSSDFYYRQLFHQISIIKTVRLQIPSNMLL